MNTTAQNTEQIPWTKKQQSDGLYAIRQGAGLVCRDLTQEDCDTILSLLADNQRLREQIEALKSQTLEAVGKFSAMEAELARLREQVERTY